MTLDATLQMLISMAWAGAIFAGVASLAGLCTWVERKLASMIQDRIGPNRGNFMEFTAIFAPIKVLKPIFKDRWTAWGLFHILADPTKMFMKEDFIPAGANRLLHTLAPMISLFVPFIVFSVLPFAGPLHIQWKDFPAETIPGLSWLISQNWIVHGHNLNLCAGFRGDTLHLSDYYVKFVIADLDVGMLFVFAIASLAVYGVLLAGFSSNNKFSFLGAVRGANQMISYEVALGLCAVGLFMIYGGISTTTLVEKQGDLLLGVIPKWGIVTQPLAFLLFFTCGMAEIKKVPFDLPEGESEIVAGYFVEYSSLKFTMFLFGEYVEMILLAAVMTTLFFGGWQIPWISQLGWHFGPWSGNWADIAWLKAHLGMMNGVRAVIALVQAGKFATCVCIGVYLEFMVRWSYPRVRYDQLMRMGWKMVLPLALLNIAITGVVMAILRGWL